MCAGAPRTNLIIHRGSADIFDQVTESIRTCGPAQECCDRPLIFQRGEVPDDTVKFPGSPNKSGWPMNSEN